MDNGEYSTAEGNYIVLTIIAQFLSYYVITIYKPYLVEYLQVRVFMLLEYQQRR